MTDLPAFPIGETASGRQWEWRAAPIPLEMSARLGVDDLAARLFLSRGCQPEDLPRLMQPTLRDWMPDPSRFKDMDKAAKRLADAVQAGEQITLFADYDVDGATSAAILSRALSALGVDAGHYIPDRLLEGYGPSAEALLKLKSDGADLVVVLDCGIQAFEPLGAAADAGLDVVVVDHHKASPELPPAVAIVNPARLDEPPEMAAYLGLCTAALAFLLAAALVRELRQRGYFEKRIEPRLGELLDLVALGTVADVMPVTGFNRALVALGLKHMARRTNPGLDALFTVGGLDRAPNAEDLGFILGPRINAGGRVGQADLGVRLLTTTNPDEARELAEALEKFNQERRQIEAQVTSEAMAALDKGPVPDVAIVSGAGWHPGVVGIAASRVKERLNRPTIVLAEGEDGIAKGSGRSIDGVDLGAAVLAAKEAGLLVAGGGHAMACGVTVETSRIDELRAFLQEKLASQMGEALRLPALKIDLSVAAGGMNMALAEALQVVEPCGNGWPRPRVAVGPVRLVQTRRIGRDDAPHIRIVASGADGGRVEGVVFRAVGTPLGDLLLSAGNMPLWLAGRVVVNSWQGRDKAELRLDDAAPAG